MDRTHDPGLVGRISRIGAQAGSQRLGATVYEIAPGAVSSPFHAHHANEELIIVLAGSPMLRTPETERPLASGEVVSCPAGGRGAHQLRNETSEPVRVIVISTMVYPEIVEMLDSDKVLAQSAPPGTAARIALAFPRAAQLDRLAGEPSPGPGVET
ncbi:MAG TPA: cupin domain-containing protein [Solirubrobacteraceae bacterium]